MASPDIDAAEYKRLVEARIANNDGSTFAEVLAVTSVLLSITVVSGTVTWFIGSQFRRGGLVSTAIEIALCCGSVLLAITRPTPEDSQATALIMLAVAAVSLLLRLLLTKQSNSTATAAASTDAKKKSTRRSFFSDFRGALMLFTSACILACDFQVFPLRHMKTETYGISLMDTGVGSFVFSAGFALGGKRGSGGSGSKWQWLGSAIPLLFLGGVRVAIIAITDYQEHMTEYGKHWNFFVTLAVLPVLFVLMEAVFSVVWKLPVIRSMSWLRRPGVQAAVLAAVYEFVLTRGGLAAFIGSDVRRNVIEANKEGLSSSIGYLAIYLGAIEMGQFMLVSRQRPQEEISGSMKVLVVDALLWVACLGAHTSILPCSRRMCNLAYVLFTLTFNSTYVALFMFVEATIAARGGGGPNTSSKGDKSSGSKNKNAGLSGMGAFVLEAINRNQLFIFLVANLSTGAVNLSMRTIFAPPQTSYAVLSLYLAWVCSVAVVLHKLGFTLKFW